MVTKQYKGKYHCWHCYERGGITGVKFHDHEHTHELIEISAAPQFVQAGNGATIAGHSKTGVAYMPAMDDNCYVRLNFVVPSIFPSPNTVTLRILYFTSTSANYSTDFSIEAWSDGDAWVANQSNVLNTDNQDFAGSNGVIDIHTLDLNDADIVNGCSLGLFIQSDANNPGYLMITGIELVET